eukprot:TRINITY_DN2212_c0_g1_i1.p2 TRINITY_DN2212_c0_g1~~TRINITY_DN2212_c0_g1_i1.p2  ORF type:complete len:176 (-),score=35.04 TRINITY_DN2212_c0_g1_i1:745-1272(-)
MIDRLSSLVFVCCLALCTAAHATWKDDLLSDGFGSLDTVTNDVEEAVKFAVSKLGAPHDLKLVDLHASKKVDDDKNAWYRLFIIAHVDQYEADAFVLVEHVSASGEWVFISDQSDQEWDRFETIGHEHQHEHEHEHDEHEHNKHDHHHQEHNSHHQQQPHHDHHHRHGDHDHDEL